MVRVAVYDVTWSALARDDIISQSRGAFILSGTDASNRKIMIYLLKTNPFSGIGLVSELFLSTHVSTQI